MLESSPNAGQQAVNQHSRVVVYGARWCAASQSVRRFLDHLGVPYLYHDIDREPESARQVRWWTGGYASHPIIDVGGDILIEPSLDELRDTLARHDMI